jgi:hypothetical protein
MVTIESAGIIISSRYKIESTLKERKAFDATTAMDPNVAQINFIAVLDIMERVGLIAKTADGKIYMTPKGQETQIRGFSLNGVQPNYEKIIRFSHNK